MSFTTADLLDAHQELQCCDLEGSARGDVLGFGPMELNQIKRLIKDLEERTDSLRRYL